MLNWRDPRNPLAGGAERVSLAFLRGLRERGHHVDWFSYDFPGAAPREDIDGIGIHRGGGVLSSVLAARRWYRRQAPYDLVIDQHHGLPWFAPWWCRTRCLAYIHEVLGPIWSSFYHWPVNRLGPWQERWVQWLYRRTPFWVPSESTRLALHQHGIREVHVYDNGVDVEPLPILPPKVPTLPLRLIAVSRLAPNKRVDHAIGCLDELRRRGVAARLSVVGDGMEADRLRRLAAELDLGEQVQFRGWVAEADKHALLREHHILLHPSVREGWGLNVIEANALGTPAVVYPVHGLVDSTVHGETGFICRGETPRDLADGVAWMADDAARYDRVRTAAWRRTDRYRWSMVIPPTCDFLEAQAGRRRR